VGGSGAVLIIGYCSHARRSAICAHTRRRASSLMPLHCAISSIVREHPSHQPVLASIRQTEMHGDGTGVTAGSGTAAERGRDDGIG